MKKFLKLFDSQSNENLIQFYDECNIFILLYRGHPQLMRAQQGKGLY